MHTSMSICLYIFMDIEISQILIVTDWSNQMFLVQKFMKSHIAVIKYTIKEYL